MEIKCDNLRTKSLFASKAKKTMFGNISEAVKLYSYLGVENNIRSFISDSTMHFTEYSSEGVCVKNLLTKVL